MRLPLLDGNDQASFDMELLNKLVDTFIEKGFSYFDTALPYHNAKGEEAVRKALVQRHARDSFMLATKLPTKMLKADEDQERIFNGQLERCGVQFFDYYLLHNIGYRYYQPARQYDSFSFIQRKKQEGKIKKIGMSFHDTPELLDEILTRHPGLDFVQLQINYLDWESPGIQSRRCYEVARKHNLPIIVMEPCKGGNLATVPPKAEQLMKAYNPDASIPSWAIRFAAGLEGVVMVLSGMNTMEQVLDNTSYMTDFKPLNEEESRILRQVTDIINEETVIPCTACRYCEDGCPEKIAISDYFGLYNNIQRMAPDSLASPYIYYANLAATHGKASNCTDCKQCEEICPQRLKVTELLKDVSAVFDRK